MKKLIYISILIIMFIQFASCGTDEQKNFNDSPESVSLVVSKQWQMHEYDTDSFSLKMPMGIVGWGDSLYICDAEDNTIKKYDQKLDLIETYGALGNAEGQFIYPTGIAISDDAIYVLDSGNNRIQSFSSDMKFIVAYPLLTLNKEYGDHYIDLVSTNNVLYFTTNCIDERACIYQISDQAATTIIEGFHGRIGSDDNSIYAITNMEPYTDGDNKGYRSGSNDIFQVNSKDPDKIGSLPFKYTPTAFCIVEEDLFILSASWGRLDHFSKEGEYIETLASLPDSSIDMYMTFYDGSFYITDSLNKKVYVIEQF